MMWLTWHLALCCCWEILLLAQLLLNWRKSNANSSMWNGVSHIWDSQLMWFLVFHSFGNVGLLSQEKGFFPYYLFCSNIRIIYFVILFESCLLYCYWLIQRKKINFMMFLELAYALLSGQQNKISYTSFTAYFYS